MAAIARRSQRAAISRAFVLATGDDLDGTTDNTQAVNVTGAARVIITQANEGTAGTAGVDVVEVSHDGGATWAADDTVLLATANDFSGTILAAGALNAAGVEPTTFATSIFKAGPWTGPTALRIGRKTTTTTGTTWVTGAPLVTCYVIGGGTGTPSALA
jgi:hypothetical protein